MKKILKYSTILGAVALLGMPIPQASADTGGYIRIKNFDSHFKQLGFNQVGCTTNRNTTNTGLECLFASELDEKHSLGTSGSRFEGQVRKNNELKWNKDDGEGIVAGADFGFFRLEVEGTYQDGKATEWRGHAATGGRVYQARLFANVVVEPLDLISLLGEFGGIEPLYKYNPATYGISPYAMYGYGVMGGLLTNLAYTRNTVSEGTNSSNSTEDGGFAGGAMAAVNVGAGVNIGLDQLARGFSQLSGATMPEYFKLPIEFSIGYHWQVGLDDLLFESVGEDLGIDDGGLTYSIGLKW